jgi:hypothetical protein
MRVWVLQYSHKHGEDLTAYATPQAAEAGIAEIVREWWASEMRGEEGVPASPAELSDAEAVEMYFNHTSETHEIHDLLVYP